MKTRVTLIVELFGVFLRESPGCIEKLRQAARAGDAQGLEEMAHRLKGASLSAAARAMAETCRELEGLGRAGGTDGAMALIEQLESQFVRTRQEMTAIMERPQAVQD